MVHVPARVRRLSALAALFALTGPAVQAGVVPMSQWGAPPGVAQPTAAGAARCLEVEEARGRGGIRFEPMWSRDAACQARAAAAGTPAPVAPAAQVPPAATPPLAPLPVPQAPAATTNAAAPGAPAPTAAPAAAPAASAVVQSAQRSSAAPASDAPPAASGSTLPPVPVPPSAEAPAAAPSSPTPTPTPTPAPAPAPEPEPEPLAWTPEAQVPEPISISSEQEQPAPAVDMTSLANEFTGAWPRPVTEMQLQAPGTIPEPSSLWLLALGAAAAWRSSQRGRRG